MSTYPIPCKALATAGAWFALLGCVAPCAAATYEIDDSASVVLSPVTPLHWRANGQGAARDSAADALTQVQLVLNTQPWAGRHGRVFMALAPQPVRVKVRWTTRGPMLAGSLQSGQRVLVYDGVLPASLRDFLELVVSADGRELNMPQRLNFSYQIDVDR
jgi:hypothetical protein